MRSRYTAFVRRDFAYLVKTWHPETVPELSEDEPSNWAGLSIIETAIDEDGESGEVEFIAKLVIGDRLEILHEVSDFEKVDGRWVYHSGEFKNEDAPAKRISMKAPCPCGSGEAFKHCHFKG
jgi:SEC-C motif-containing protein